MQRWYRCPKSAWHTALLWERDCGLWEGTTPISPHAHGGQPSSSRPSGPLPSSWTPILSPPQPTGSSCCSSFRMCSPLPSPQRPPWSSSFISPLLQPCGLLPVSRLPPLLPTACPPAQPPGGTCEHLSEVPARPLLRSLPSFHITQREAEVLPAAREAPCSLGPSPCLPSHPLCSSWLTQLPHSWRETPGTVPHWALAPAAPPPDTRTASALPLYSATRLGKPCWPSTPASCPGSFLHGTHPSMPASQSTNLLYLSLPLDVGIVVAEWGWGVCLGSFKRSLWLWSRGLDCRGMETVQSSLLHPSLLPAARVLFAK